MSQPTAKELYDLYVETGRQLFAALQPTAEEIKAVNEEMIDIGIEDLLCGPFAPEEGGDLGLLACLVYEHRDAVEAEKGEGDENEA